MGPVGIFFLVLRMFATSTIKFLKDLARNNNKPWMDDHRTVYLAAKEDFESFVSSLIKKTGPLNKDIGGLEVKNCVFRINRDIRFSKNKAPYKTNMGASLDRGGKKSIYAGYYFHLEPGKSFAGGGIWMPMAPELKKIRQEIDYSFDEFQKILSNKMFKAQYGQLDDSSELKLTNLPRGYEKDNPAAEYLKLKSILALRSIPDADLTKPTLLTQTIKAFEALTPLLHFMNRSLE